MFNESVRGQSLNTQNETLKKSLPLVDPDPGKCYTRAKTAKCVQQPDPEEEDPSQEGNWTTETKDLPKQFSYISILEHARKSGRNSASYVKKPLENRVRHIMPA